MNNNIAVVRAQGKLEAFVNDNYSFETREEYAAYQAKSAVAAQATKRFVVLLEMGTSEEGAFNQAFAWMVANL